MTFSSGLLWVLRWTIHSTKEFIIHDVLGKPDRLFLTVIIVFVCGFAKAQKRKQHSNRGIDKASFKDTTDVEHSRRKSRQLRPEYTSTAGAIASIVQTVAKTIPKSLDTNKAAEDVLTIRANVSSQYIGTKDRSGPSSENETSLYESFNSTEDNSILNSNGHIVSVKNNLGSQKSDIVAEDNLINSKPTVVRQNKTKVSQDKSCTILVNTSSLPNINSSTNNKRKSQEEELEQVPEELYLDLVQEGGDGAIHSSFDNLVIVEGDILEEQNDGATLEDDSTILLNDSYSTEDSFDTSKMGGNPLKNFRQKLLDKEKSRKDRFKNLSERLKFWRKKDIKEKTQENTTVEEEETASTTSKREALPKTENENIKKRSDPRDIIEERYPDHPSTTLPLQANASFPTIKLTLKTEPVVYNISYKDEVRMRDRNKERSFFHWFIPNRIIKIRNKNYSYSYRAEADLLRRDWESALERHSDRHPITYNRCMWMTTSHARKLVNQKNENAEKRFRKSNCFLKTKPLKSRHQELKVKKTFPSASNACTYYNMTKISNFVPLPYEHLIRQDIHRRPATQTTPKIRRPKREAPAPKLVVQYPRHHGHFNYSPAASVGYVPSIYPRTSHQPRMGTRVRPNSVLTPAPNYYLPQA